MGTEPRSQEQRWPHGRRAKSQDGLVGNHYHEDTGWREAELGKSKYPGRAIKEQEGSTQEAQSVPAPVV